MVIVLAFQLEVLKYEATAGPQLGCIAGGGISGKKFRKTKKVSNLSLHTTHTTRFSEYVNSTKVGGGGGGQVNQLHPSLASAPSEKQHENECLLHFM